MSTGAYIGKLKEKTGEVEFIYIHSDGYPSFVGTALNTKYTDENEVAGLIAGGDVSLFARETAKPLFYCFDKGGAYDTFSLATTPRVADYINDFNEEDSIKYAYLYLLGAWYLLMDDNKFHKFGDLNIVDTFNVKK